MAGRRRRLHNDVRIEIDGVDGPSSSSQARPGRLLTNRAAPSVLRPSEQLRRYRYGSEVQPHVGGGPGGGGGGGGGRANEHTADLYANLLELRESAVKTPEVADTAYEHLYDHLQDVLEAGQVLRQLPMGMSEKRKLFKLCKRFELKNINALSGVDSWKFNWIRFKVAARKRWDALTSFSLFGGAVKSVERSHGSGVASYFLFLRALLGLNVFLFILMLGFVIIPQVVIGDGLDVPPSARNGSRLSLILDGKGYLMEYSVLFYGYYDNATRVVDGSSAGYSLPLAYAVTTGVVLILSFIFLARRVLGQDNVAVYTARKKLPFTWFLLASWDYSIANKRASDDRSEIITDKLRKAIKQDELPYQKWCVRSIRAAVHGLVILLLVGSVCAIYFTVRSARCILLTSQDLDLTQFLDKGAAGIGDFFSVMRVPLVVSSLNIVMPFFFELMSQWNWEKRHPRAYLKLTLARSFILYLANFIVLLVSLFTQMTSDPTMGNEEDISCCLQAVQSQYPNGKMIINGQSACQRLAEAHAPNIVNDSALCYDHLQSSHSNVVEKFSCLATIGSHFGHQSRRCWETLVGQELFKLLCIDLLLEIIVSIFLAEFVRGVFVKTNGFKCCGSLAKKIKCASFSTSQNVLSLVYQQSLAWFGTLFCPFLLGIAAFGCLLVLLLRTVMCRWFLRPQHVFRDFRGSARYYHMVALLAMLLVTLFAVGYVFVELEPSSSCGPFRSLPSMGSIVSQEIHGWASWLVTTVDYIRSAAVVCILLLLLCALAYYQWCQATAYKEFQKDLVFQMKVLRSKLKVNRPTGSASNTLRSPVSHVALTTPDGDVRTVTLPRVIPSLPPQPPAPAPVVAPSRLAAKKKPKESNDGKQKKKEQKKNKKEEKKKKKEDKRSLLESDHTEHYNDVFEDLYAVGRRDASINRPPRDAKRQPHMGAARLGVPLPGLQLPSRERFMAHISVPDRFVGTDDDPLMEEEMPADFFRNPLLPQESTL